MKTRSAVSYVFVAPVDLLHCAFFQVVETPADPALISDGAALSAYQYFENVRNYTVAMQQMGLPTFDASDLEHVREPN